VKVDEPIPSRFAEACQAKRYDIAANLLIDKIEKSFGELEVPIEELVAACDGDKREDIWNWFRRAYPRAMSYVRAENKYGWTKAVQLRVRSEEFKGKVARAR
jgi:hypothetical protein